MTQWGSRSTGQPPSTGNAGQAPYPGTNIIPDKRLLVKALGFMAWTVQADGDTWIEVLSNCFADGVCVLDLETAQELKRVVLASVDRLGEGG